ncbi:MAG: glycoside hydrolase family 3 C-terminal domain-containing protein [Oscillospiraceae bacterium]|jgi:beta-glucosidase|nr:glycoside hydrolase family 3 C-terminal domain-containing protein [Oscillospiraceae bacterium]
MNERTRAKELVALMTLEEKASLCSGLNFWQLKGIERLGLKPVMVTDGPHGLRKQAGESDHLGINKSVPATCFPAACATACSFDAELLTEIGRAMGEECLQEDVAVILGPGVNIKRSPLCGRNFEYFSEDPLLAGELGGALISGVQEKGVGTSLKHYASNNQETRRMSINAVVDDRALYEIYLKAFEIAVKKSSPWTLMCSYNKINGVYSSDNKWLLTEVLRDGWGFEGLVMTDWGAMNDRVEGVRAGLDLEMPGLGRANDEKIVAAVKNGSLKESEVDAAAGRVTEMILKSQAARKPGYRYNAEAHHALARKAAAESCVLLKNEDGILPLKPGAKVAVIGGFARSPRYQGAGSSKINPTRIGGAYDELEKYGFDLSYAEGYKGLEPDLDLIKQAETAAKDADIALVFAGLPDEYESEGFDRRSFEMPQSHMQLIGAVAKANPNTVVVLQLGSAVATGWAENVKALLVSYLGGQASGEGAADVLAGKVCPGGRLAETWPLALEDNPSFRNFPGGRKTVEYRESVFVGYRYYDTAKKAVAWPFGFGLSYTSFAYGGIKTDGNIISFTVTNTGSVAGAEVAQVYAGLPDSKIFRPKKWLAAFKKVFLEPGESKVVKVRLGKEAFEHYSRSAGGWQLEAGTYTIYVGSSVRDIKLKTKITVEGEDLPDSGRGTIYYNLKDNAFPEKDFAEIYGRPLPPPERGPGEAFTVNDTLDDIKDTALGKKIIAVIQSEAKKMLGGMGDDITAMANAMLMEMPLRGISMMSGGALPQDFAQLLVNSLNGNIFSRTVNTIRLVLAASKANKKQKA